MLIPYPDLGPWTSKLLSAGLGFSGLQRLVIRSLRSLVRFCIQGNDSIWYSSMASLPYAVSYILVSQQSQQSQQSQSTKHTILETQERNLQLSRPATIQHIAAQGQTDKTQALSITGYPSRRCRRLKANARSRCLSFHNLARLIATRAVLAGKHPLLNAPLGTTWALDARHLGWHLSAYMERP